MAPADGVRGDAVRRLDDIKRDADAATKGPWRAEDTGRIQPDVVDAGPSACSDPHCRTCGYVEISDGDARFIANARTDVPDLVALVERLRESLKDCINEIGRLSEVLCEEPSDGLIESARAALAAADGADGARDAKERP